MYTGAYDSSDVVGTSAIFLSILELDYLPGVFT